MNDINNYGNNQNGQDSVLKYDELKMYFGEDYWVTNKIKIMQPTIGDIVEWGEREYYSMIHVLTCIPSDMKSQLEDIGINYMEISDFELFILLSHGLTPKETGIILGDLDLSQFVQVINNENGELCLYWEDRDIVIDKYVYLKIVDYLRKLHGIKPKIQNAYNETTRQILIKLERKKIEKAKKEP